jgi:hypothetical protein
VDEVKNQSFLIHKSYEGFEIMAEKFVPHFEGRIDDYELRKIKRQLKETQKDTIERNLER